ncbi:hypothetical protein PISMIDRAFT_280121 [Pisolithus microcarpus 441]|uniref:Ig-like domain-containing protein n=1 Tax=Pisolithus microcarpus 441 TaxID=765257 RepID=A0A0C9Z1B2_9AGAM|nr:hypothetical protein BKA83DRAFT_280121 [Pisolithus microcarpus]KIK16017.1 hypothetical protein PISMIDRAFT_280121 [Pisolithus microcarpus 441]
MSSATACCLSSSSSSLRVPIHIRYVSRRASRLSTALRATSATCTSCQNLMHDAWQPLGISCVSPSPRTPKPLSFDPSMYEANVGHGLYIHMNPPMRQIAMSICCEQGLFHRFARRSACIFSGKDYRANSSLQWLSQGGDKRSDSHLTRSSDSHPTCRVYRCEK